MRFPCLHKWVYLDCVLDSLSSLRYLELVVSSKSDCSIPEKSFEKAGGESSHNDCSNRLRQDVSFQRRGNEQHGSNDTAAEKHLPKFGLIAEADHAEQHHNKDSRDANPVHLAGAKPSDAPQVHTQGPHPMGPTDASGRQTAPAATEQKGKGSTLWGWVEGAAEIAASAAYGAVKFTVDQVKEHPIRTAAYLVGGAALIAAAPVAGALGAGAAAVAGIETVVYGALTVASANAIVTGGEQLVHGAGRSTDAMKTLTNSNSTSAERAAAREKIAEELGPGLATAGLGAVGARMAAGRATSAFGRVVNGEADVAKGAAASTAAETSTPPKAETPPAPAKPETPPPPAKPETPTPPAKPEAPPPAPKSDAPPLPKPDAPPPPPRSDVPPASPRPDAAPPPRPETPAASPRPDVSPPPPKPEVAPATPAPSAGSKPEVSTSTAPGGTNKLDAPHASAAQSAENTLPPGWQPPKDAAGNVKWAEMTDAQSEAYLEHLMKQTENLQSLNSVKLGSNNPEVQVWRFNQSHDASRDFSTGAQNDAGFAAARDWLVKNGPKIQNQPGLETRPPGGPTPQYIDEGQFAFGPRSSALSTDGVRTCAAGICVQGDKQMLFHAREMDHFSAIQEAMQKAGIDPTKAETTLILGPNASRTVPNILRAFTVDGQVPPSVNVMQFKGSNPGAVVVQDGKPYLPEK